MNTPLILFKIVFPQDILNNIQSYLVNDHVIKALNKYFDSIIKSQECYNTHIFKNNKCECKEYWCININNYKIKECTLCWYFDNSDYYIIDKYKLIIKYNTQFNKIRNFFYLYFKREY